MVETLSSKSEGLTGFSLIAPLKGAPIAWSKTFFWSHLKEYLKTNF